MDQFKQYDMGYQENYHDNYYNGDSREKDYPKEDCPEQQRHVHEFVGSVKLNVMNDEELHNHRFAGITGEAIIQGSAHVHKVLSKTDFYDEHFHEVCDVTGPAIQVSDDRHVHLVCGNTTMVDGHVHEFKFATLIENPIGD